MEKVITFIAVVCYLIGEIIKIIFKDTKKIKRIIPIVLSFVGALLGALIYFINKEMINVDNIYNALLIGIISGISSTGAYEAIKKIVNK